MYVVLAIPTVGAILKDAALRKQCVTDTIWKVYVAELHFIVVQLLSHVQLFVIPWTAALQAFLSFTISQSLLKFMSIESVMPSNHLILCHPFSCLQSFPASGSFPMSWLFTSGGQTIGVLELQLQ